MQGGESTMFNPSLGPNAQCIKIVGVEYEECVRKMKPHPPDPTPNSSSYLTDGAGNYLTDGNGNKFIYIQP